MFAVVSGLFVGTESTLSFLEYLLNKLICELLANVLDFIFWLSPIIYLYLSCRFTTL